MNHTPNPEHITSKAAKASWILPLAALAFMTIGKKATETGIGSFILGGVMVILFLAGIVFAFIGLFGNKQHLTRSPVLPSVIGLSLNTLLLSIFLFGAVTSFIKTRSDLADLKDKETQAYQEILEQGQTGKKTEEYLNSVKKEMHQAVERQSGDNKKGLKILMTLNETLQNHGLACNKKTNAMDEYGVWNFDTLKINTDYHHRYQLIDEAHKACRKCVDLIAGVETYIDSEFAKAAIKTETKIKLKTNFLEGFNQNRTYNQRIYEIVCQQHTVTKKMLKLLENNHDQWGFEESQLVIYDDGLLSRYNKLNDNLANLDTEKMTIVKTIHERRNPDVEKTAGQ